MTTRLRTAAAAPLIAALLLVSALFTAQPNDAPTRVLVAAEGAVSDAVAAIVEAGGTVVDRFDNLGVVVADVREPAALEGDARIALVQRDRAIEPQAKPTLPDGTRAPNYDASAQIQADVAGTTGEGIAVAVIDTGVSRTSVTKDRLIAAVDTSRDRNLVDHFGHGTFMAGLIAGSPDGDFSGVAPDARIVSIKVADAEGGATVSSVVSGIAAADAARHAFGVKVVLLAAGGPPGQGENGEPDLLELLLRQLWARGMTVVVPSGNVDPNDDVEDVVASPGLDPFLLTAGAWNDVTRAAATFSAGDEYKPDVLAPGASVVSARAPGSLVDRENKASRIGSDLFRGSGTSMAAAITAGAAALVLEADPTLTPDQVKGLLIEHASADGLVNAAAAVAAAEAGNVPDYLQTDQNGESLDALWPDLELDDEELETKGNSWVGNSWVGNSWVGNSWVGNSWVGNSWVGNSWVGNSWVGNSWVGNSWVGNSWVGNSWVGNSWVGNSWVGNSWVGNSWVGNSWVGNSWVGNSWVGNSWVGNSWVGNSWVADSWVGFSWVADNWQGNSWVGGPSRGAPSRGGPGTVTPDGNSWV